MTAELTLVAVYFAAVFVVLATVLLTLDHLWKDKP